MRIALVSYINTWPFIWGLKQYPQYELLLDVPSRCFSYFQEGIVDIALVPVGALLQTSTPYQLLPEFCIGAKKRVETVVLLSNYPLSELKTIYLDPESQTSNLLVQVLCAHHWQIQPQFLYRPNPIPNPTPYSAYVCIGDKVLSLLPQYQYCYDLAKGWYEFTGKGFPFAVWIGKQELSPQKIQPFLNALRAGIESIPHHPLPAHNSIDAEYIYYYLSEVIDYHFDEEKEKSMNFFLTLSKELIHTCVKN